MPQHRDDLTPEEHGLLVRGIVDGSRQALEELRDVLGVLRADQTSPEPPEPALDGIPGLVADARTAGLDVTLTNTMIVNGQADERSYWLGQTSGHPALGRAAGGVLPVK